MEVGNKKAEKGFWEKASVTAVYTPMSRKTVHWLEMFSENLSKKPIEKNSKRLRNNSAKGRLKNPPVNDDRFFDAEVVEIWDGTALVKPIGGKDAPLEGEVVISTDANQVPEMQAGTRIRVMFGGEIAETAPPQIDVVFAIYLLDEIEQ